jgi:hypothetical protein
MEQPLSPLNQGLNPVRAAGQWGQLVGLPAASPAIDSRVALPVAAPLWLALQPYANARLCLFEVDRPESRSPVPIRRHVIDCFLEQAGIVGGYNDTALTDPGDVLLRGYLCRAAILPVSTSNWRPNSIGLPQAFAVRHRSPGIQRCWARCRPPARG